MPSRPRSLLERLPLLSARPVLAYALAVGLSLLACVLRGVLDPIFPPGFPYLTFFPTVIISSFVWGRGPGTLAAVLCGLMAWYFFIPPFHSFALGRSSAVALAFYAGVVAVDIALVHWMQRANARLREERERNAALAAQSARLADRNELLFGELQHRVSNNLQMVGAVLNLQKRAITDVDARQALDEAAAKLQLIGRIQRQLYDLSGQRTAVDAYLEELVGDLVASAGKPGITYRVDAQAELLLDPDAVIPVALITAECVANALEHGFASRDTGHIHVTLRRGTAALELQVRDDGAGPPAGFSLTSVSSLGLKIASTLARQIGGEFDVRAGETGGALSCLTVPLTPPKAA